MIYFYHGIPEKMEGSELIPLNEMFKLDKSLHDKYLEKYKGREEILERKIPLLNCSWEDVVQMLPLHPRKLFELQKDLGLIDEIPDYQYFQINPTDLDRDKSVVYFKTAPGEENATVRWLSDVDLVKVQDIPLATRAYYGNMIGKNEPVFNYQFVPHILYRGTVKVSQSSTIRLND